MSGNCLRMGGCVWLLLLALSAAAMGWGDWQEQTPGGHQMGDAGGGISLFLAGRDHGLTDIDRWYFYKDHLVVKTISGFFVVEEQTGQITPFDSEAAWHAYLAQHGLEPRYWTRWYTGNWRWLHEYAFGVLLVALLVLVPGIYHSLRFASRWVAGTAELRAVRKPALLTGFLLLLLLLRFLLDQFPSSF